MVLGILWLAWMGDFQRVSLTPNLQSIRLMVYRQGTRIKGDFSKVWLSWLLLAIVRVVRMWNQTGQKHAGEPDIAKAILPAHNFVLWCLALAAYSGIAQRLSKRAVPWASRRVSSATSLALGLIALNFKVAFTKADTPELLDGLPHFLLRFIGVASLVAQARALFISVAVLLLLSSFPKTLKSVSFNGEARGTNQSHIKADMQVENESDLLRHLHDLFTLFLMTQSRVTNIPLFLLFEIQFNILDYLQLSRAALTLTSLIFQYASFFAFGGSNAISSVDLSNAYNGVARYNAVAVGILTFCGNWAGPLWWASATTLMVSNRRDQGQEDSWFANLLVHTAFSSSSAFFVMLACMTLRTHLFIWTVFSPKYLYSMVWSVGQHLCINIGLSSLLLWVGTA